MFLLFSICLEIVYNFIITILQKTLSSPKKGPCGKILTWQHNCGHFSSKNCGEMHTRKNMFGHFSLKKRPLWENSHTAKKITHFFRERNFYVSQIFTSQNQIFHRGKHLFCVHIFSYTFFSYTFFLLEHNGVLLEHNGGMLEHNGVLLEHSGVLLEHN